MRPGARDLEASLGDDAPKATIYFPEAFVQGLPQSSDPERDWALLNSFVHENFSIVFRPLYERESAEA